MSKRIWNHPAERQTGRKYWRSMGELQDTPEFRNWLEVEFPRGAAEMRDQEDAETSRRSFLKLMGAATAMAGFGVSCRRPEAFIKPYSKNVEWVIPGRATFYASAMPKAGGVVPVVVTTFEGRPTHIAGNSLHPESNGSVDSQTQASVLDLYDPDRAKHFKHGGKKATQADFLKWLEAEKAKALAAGGKGVALLVDEVESPTRKRLIAQVLTKLPQAKVYRHEALSSDAERKATEAVFGPGVVQVPHFSACDKILSLDHDFLGIDRPKASSVSKFMDGRRAKNPGDPMNRLYVLESRYSLTGGMADHRLRIAPSQTVKVAVALAQALAEATGDAALGTAASSLQLYGKYEPRADYAVWIKEAAKDLAASKGGKALIVAGPRQSAVVHALVAAMNNALGAFTTASDKKVPPLELKQADARKEADLVELIKSATAGEVSHLFVLGQLDPSYTTPSDLKWDEAQAKIANVVTIGTRDRTATARKAQWNVPGTHFLEQWGDVRGMSGAYSIVQPMILPLFDGVSDLVFLSWLSQDSPLPVEPPKAAEPMAPLNGALPEASTDVGYLAVVETFKTLVPQGADFDTAWSEALRDGVLKGVSYAAATAKFNASGISSVLAGFKDLPEPQPTGMDVLFMPDAKIGDGRFVNNGWLQESPDPISKIVWDNAAVVSIKTAETLGLSLDPRETWQKDQAQAITIEVNGATLTLPVLAIPGVADNTVVVALGYGQQGEGEQGPGRVGEATGWNAYPLRTSQSPFVATGAKVNKSKAYDDEDYFPIATTQEHNTMYGRELVREGTVERFKADPNFAYSEGADGHIPQDFSFYKQTGGFAKPGLFADEPQLWDKSHQWGMVIDLNACIGCHTCSVACQSENNIPIVGKQQVMRGREMHWIRMDRYFAIDLDGKKSDETNTYDRHEQSGGIKDFVRGGKLEREEHGKDLDDPELLFQPVACQQCEAAPCETVCPVNATVHSEDGLNVMAYNRCIGTRYCANNCPYKARRFNYFDYNKRDPLTDGNGNRDNVRTEEGLFDLAHRSNLYKGPLGEVYQPESLKLQKNPNVSVRMRGVIEKCTYCIQRLEAAKIDAKRISREKAAKEGQTGTDLKISHEDLRAATDKVKTACQQACPSDAIVFGNLLDEKSQVAQLKHHPRNYDLLRYIGTKPRTSYLARIKNPNPDLLAKSEIEKRKVGQATAHMH